MGQAKKTSSTINSRLCGRDDVR